MSQKSFRGSHAVSTLAVVLVSLILALCGASPARAISFDLSGGGDCGEKNTQGLSVSCTSAGLDLTLSALGTIPDQALPLAGGNPGAVFINGAGSGVRASHQAGRSGRTHFRGSKQISGSGRFQDEALSLDFGSAVDASSVVLTLTRFKAHKKGPSRGDAASLYIDSPSGQVVSPQDVLDNLVKAGKKGTYTLALADLGLSGAISSVAVRATNGHFFVVGVDVSGLAPVPEPGTALLLASALAGLALLRRRARA